MKRPWMLITVSAVALALVAARPRATSNNSNKESRANSPVYAANGDLKFPTQYREWVYVSSGVDMSYSPNMSMDHSIFDNVFVNPEAYQAFVQTGSWPDKTVLVLEARMARSKGSINKTGQFQTDQIMDVSRQPS